MAHSILNPEGLHDPTPFGYSHTATIPASSALVLISGQYGSDGEGGVVSPQFADQVERAFENLATALAAHDLDLTSVAQLRTYVVNPDFEKLGVIGAAVRAGCGDTPPTQTVVGVTALAQPEMLFEVEAIAAK